VIQNKNNLNKETSLKNQDLQKFKIAAAKTSLKIPSKSI